jgi:hypothetical protein
MPRVTIRLSHTPTSLWTRLAWVGLAVLGATVALTFQDYGVTWDEPYHNVNGKNVLAYYATFFADRNVLTYHNLYLYGGVFDGLVALTNLISPFGEYQTSHLLNALVGMIGIVGTWKLARMLAGPRAAFLAALFLVLTPSWYGHMFNNPKDVPFGVAMIWALYYIARVSRQWPLVSPSATVKLGLALGVTLGMRIGGLIIFIYLAAAFAAYLAMVRDRRPTALVRAFTPVFARALIPAGVIAYAVMLVCWPWAQQDPIFNPINALKLFSHIAWNLDVLFEGRLVNSMHLPTEYLPVYFAIRLPELVLALLVFAGPYGAILWWRHGIAALSRDAPAYAALAAAITFPFIYFVIARPVTYDCMRHFLFVLPPIAVAAGLVGDRLMDEAGRNSRIAAGLAAMTLAGWTGWQVSTIVSLHPDEYVYYNRLVGGVKGAENRFELDYWGNSYHEAVDRLVAKLQRERGPVGTIPTYHVAVCSSGISASAFFPSYLKLADSAEDADFYISVTRLDCDDELDGEEIVRVTRDDALLSVVKDRRALRVAHPERMRALGTVAVRVHPGAISPIAPGVQY